MRTHSPLIGQLDGSYHGNNNYAMSMVEIWDLTWSDLSLEAIEAASCLATLTSVADPGDYHLEFFTD